MKRTEWSSEMPDEPGLWEVRCGETDGKPERVAVTKIGGALWVHCPDIGRYTAKKYHDGLTNTEWRKIA
jgi:hypothetical protein